MVILHQKYQKREEKLEFPPCFPCWHRFKLERDFSLSEATRNYRTQKNFLAIIHFNLRHVSEVSYLAISYETYKVTILQ